jgi:predicted RNase H-like HicB family nuclease
VKFDVTVQGGGDGDYVANCEDPQCSGHGLSPANALDALRDEIRYRLELCPCTTVDEGFVQLNIVSAL